MSIAAVAVPAGAQGPTMVALGPGDSVQLVDQRVFDRGPAMRVPGTRLDVKYTTDIPASDAGARLSQADRAAQHFGAEAERVGAHRLSIGICDTRACVEGRHPPSAWHLYERGARGWRRIDPRTIR